MSLFINQNLLTIGLDTKQDVSTATISRILYRKPNNKTGYWPATVVLSTKTNLLSKLQYTLTADELDIDGPWMLQSYVVIGGKVGKGKLVTMQITRPIL